METHGVAVANADYILESCKFLLSIRVYIAKLCTLEYSYSDTLLLLLQKIGYDNAAAVAKKAHKEGSTLKVWSPPWPKLIICSLVFLESFEPLDSWNIET